MFFVNFLGVADYNKINFSKDTNIEHLGGPFDVISNKLFHGIARLCMSDKIIKKMPFPFLRIWNRCFKKYTRISEKNDGICFLFNAHYYWIIYSGLGEYIKKKIKNSYLVFYFSDKISMYKMKYNIFPEIDILKKNCDFIFSYNEVDARKYGLAVPPPVFPAFSEIEEDSEYNSDVFFVGKNKGRSELLFDLYDKFSKAGFKCIFFIPDATEAEIHRLGISYNRIPYSEVLRYVRNTKCVINIIQEGCEGITLRDYEALFYNKYLLTNNKYIKRTPFYRETQIIDLDLDYVERLKYLINQPLEPNKTIYLYNWENYYNWVRDNLNF